MLVHDDDVSEGKEKVYWIVILFDETVERMNERETALLLLIDE